MKSSFPLCLVLLSLLPACFGEKKSNRKESRDANPNSSKIYRCVNDSSPEAAMCLEASSEFKSDLAGMCSLAKLDIQAQACDSGAKKRGCRQVMTDEDGREIVWDQWFGPENKSLCVGDELDENGNVKSKDNAGGTPPAAGGMTPIVPGTSSQPSGSGTPGSGTPATATPGSGNSGSILEGYCYVEFSKEIKDEFRDITLAPNTRYMIGRFDVVHVFDSEENDYRTADYQEEDVKSTNCPADVLNQAEQKTVLMADLPIFKTSDLSGEAACVYKAYEPLNGGYEFSGANGYAEVKFEGMKDRCMIEEGFSKDFPLTIALMKIKGS